MNDTGAGDVFGAEGLEPAVGPPHPVGGEAVDEDVGGAEEQESLKVAPLGHGPGDDSGVARDVRELIKVIN